LLEWCPLKYFYSRIFLFVIKRYFIYMNKKIIKQD